MTTNLALDNDFSLADFAAGISDNLTPIEYPQGSVIFRQGESSDNAYIIDEGEVQISIDAYGKQEVVAVLGTGELLGEMSSIDKLDRSATATALTDTVIVPISHQHLNSIFSNANPLLQMLLQTLLGRLRSAQQRKANSSSAEPELIRSPAQNKHFATIRRRALTAIQLEKQLRDALNRREFELHLQPIVDLDDNHIAGFESLIRWFSPLRGKVPPNDFIGAAEASGLIVPIGLWVVEESLHLLERLQRRFRMVSPDHPPLFVSANVSARQLSEESGADRIVAAINRTGIDPQFLKVEITEGLLMEDPEAALLGLNKLKELGIDIAIDDFGTGYSSLSYLQRFPLDTMKIDGSFVRTMLKDSDSLAIVRSITNLSADLNMDVVAEGIEHETEAAALRKLNCEYGQGFLFSPAVPVTEALELLRDPYLGRRSK